MADEATTPTDDTAQAQEPTATDTQPSTEEAKPQDGTQAEPKADATNTEAEPKADAEASTDRGLLKGAEQGEVPDEYTDFDLGEDVTAEDQAALKELAKTHELSQAEAEKAAKYSRSIVEKISEDLKASEEKAVEEFRAKNKEMWEAQPDHAEKTLMADKAVKHLGAEVEKHLADAGYLHDARILGVLAEVGRLISEPTHVAGVETAGQGSSRIYSNSPDLYNS